ncbi:MAG: helix-turn-helix domain-containing protein [Bryobacteraceae bacterium]
MKEKPIVHQTQSRFWSCARPEGRLSKTPEESSAGGGAGRWSAKRKMSVILELLRGMDLDAASRKHRVTIATLTEWRDRFHSGGEANETVRRKSTMRRSEG